MKPAGMLKVVGPSSFTPTTSNLQSDAKVRSVPHFDRKEEEWEQQGGLHTSQS